MASTYSTSLKLELIGNGDQSGTWGTTTNTNLGTLLEQAITGVQAITMANTDKTLTSFNGASDEARNAVLVVGGTNSAVRNIIAPAVEKLYVIRNNTVGGFAIVIKTSASTGISIANGTTAFVYCDGSEFYLAVPSYASTNTASTLVYRDGTGNFAAGTITASSLISAALSTTGNTILGDAAGDTLVVNAAATLNATLSVTGVTTLTAAPVLNALTASSAVATNASKALVSVTNTGSGNNVLATSPTLVTPILGTPTSGTLTSCTGLPISTGVSGLGTNVATFLATPSSANLAAALTDETGTGANVFATSPTLVTPILGTPTSGTLTSCTGLPLTTGVTGTLPVANGGTGVTTSTGSGANALATSPTLVTPILGTPTSGTLTNCTGLPMTTGVTGTLPVANGGTGVTTSTGSGSTVLNTSPTLVTPALGTPASGVLTNCTGTASGLTAGLVTNGVYTTNFTSTNQSLTSNGYQKLPGGLILQWGTSASVGVESSVTVTLPLTFPTATVNVQITPIYSLIGATEGEHTVNSVTTSSFIIYNGVGPAKPFYWYAVGY